MSSFDKETQVRDWLESHNYVPLFTRMCCGHFAIASHAAGFGDLFYLESRVNPRYFGHVFVIHDLNGPFDITGKRSIKDMLTALPWCSDRLLPCNEARVFEQIDTIGLSVATTEKVYRAAEMLLRAIDCKQL